MPSKIEVLPEEIVNKIAAGEVVENSSSVVKELVENSLDALAKQINVELFGGGLQKIVVEDDGEGMSPEDLFKSLLRHATSKIKKFEDLFSLHTMGFRGEAIASIAAVSKIKMESSSSEANASILYAEGGKVLFQKPSSRTRGTSIQVDSLFYNVPARKRFQKSCKALSADVHRIMNRLSLAHPEIGFSFSSSGEQMIDVEKNDSSFELSLEERIKALFGPVFFSELLPFSFEEELFHLSGFIGKPLFARPTRSSQYLFINRRSVYSPLVDRAVREGYGTRLAEGFHPAFILHLQLPPEMVDVNVHPQKREVRLQEELLLKKTLSSLISKALDQSIFSSSPKMSLDPKDCVDESLAVFPNEEKREEFSFQAKLPFPPQKKKMFQGMKIIGSFYLVEMQREDLCLKKEGSSLVFVDLAGAYSRLLFDPMEKAVVENHSFTREKQALLVPLILEFSFEEISEIEAKKELIANLGWEVRVMGKRTLAIDAIPSIVKENEAQRLFALIVEEISSYGESDVQKRSFLQKMAEKVCSFSRGQKRSFSMQEADLYLEALFSCKDPGKDPLGRPNFAFLHHSHIQEIFLGG
jgi:DNA mismatch repair protein MutL